MAKWLLLSWSEWSAKAATADKPAFDAGAKVRVLEPMDPSKTECGFEVSEYRVGDFDFLEDVKRLKTFEFPCQVEFEGKVKQKGTYTKCVVVSHIEVLQTADQLAIERAGKLSARKPEKVGVPEKAAV